MYNETVKWAKKQLNKGSKKRLLIIAAAVILVLLIMAAAAIQILPINIIHPHARPTQPPVPIMALEMGVASAGGACTGSNSIVEFTKGTKIKSDTVAIKTSLDKGSVKFCCSKSVGKHCKGHVFPEDKFDCKEDKLEIKQDVRGKTQACPAYTIGFKQL